MRCGPARLTLERFLHRTGTCPRRLAPRPCFARIACCLFFRPGRPSFRWWKFYAGSSCLGQSNSDGLLGRTCAMFPLTDMLHLFPHKFARLRRWRLSFALVFPSSLNGFLFWHNKMLSLEKIWLAVYRLNWGCSRYAALRETGSLSAESGRMPDFQVLIKSRIVAFYFR
jgi:hypothetical protein